MTKYYSESKDEYIDINEMHHQHIWYAFKKMCEEQPQPKATSNQVFKLEKALSEEKSTVKGLREQIKRMSNTIHSIYAEQSHSSPRYHFSEIPNDYEGRDLVKQLKRYLNTDRYSMRVRGQHLDNSKLEEHESWRNYTRGQPLNKSKCFRVYIDQKKEKV